MNGKSAEPVSDGDSSEAPDKMAMIQTEIGVIHRSAEEEVGSEENPIHPSSLRLHHCSPLVCLTLSGVLDHYANEFATVGVTDEVSLRSRFEPVSEASQLELLKDLGLSVSDRLTVLSWMCEEVESPSERVPSWWNYPVVNVFYQLLFKSSGVNVEHAVELLNLVGLLSALMLTGRIG